MRSLQRTAIAVAALWACGLALAAGTAAPAATASPHPTAAPVAGAPASPAPRPKATPSSSQRLDINSASKAQLKTLPGIGDAEADRIIAARPFKVSTEIVSKAGLPEGTYFQVRRRIVAIPPDVAAKAARKAPKKPAKPATPKAPA